MKTLIIGDIHGEVTKLRALVEKAGAVDEIISVGDLIDRGEDSRAVIEFCISQGIKACKGNHELMAQEVLETYDPTKPSVECGYKVQIGLTTVGLEFGDNLRTIENSF